MAPTTTSKLPLEFVIPLNPVPASRARARMGGPGYYTGRYKEWRKESPEFIPELEQALEGALVVSIKCIVQKAKTTKRTYPQGDTDNYAKAILDGMNGKVWLDDDQVVSLRVSKRYAEKNESPRVEVRVTKGDL